MTLTEFLDKIDETARAATQGPWHLYAGDDSYSGDVTFGDQSDRGGYYLRDSDKFEKDDLYISRMDPPTTLALTAALRKCVEALENCTGGDLASGEGIYKAEVARKALASLSESFKEMK